MPIIVVSGRQAEEFKIAALDAGADDYVTKPFSVKELLARIRTNLRVQAGVPDSGGQAKISVGPMTVDLQTRRAEIDDVTLDLTKREFDLLIFFAQHPEVVLTHKQILESVWGPAYVNEAQYVRVYVGNLRKQIGRIPDHSLEIETRQGVGYMLTTRSGEH